MITELWLIFDHNPMIINVGSALVIARGGDAR